MTVVFSRRLPHTLYSTSFLSFYVGVDEAESEFCEPEETHVVIVAVGDENGSRKEGDQVNL